MRAHNKGLEQQVNCIGQEKIAAVSLIAITNYPHKLSQQTKKHTHTHSHTCGSPTNHQDGTQAYTNTLAYTGDASELSVSGLCV